VPDSASNSSVILVGRNPKSGNIAPLSSIPPLTITSFLFPSFPNWESPKINPNEWRVFRRQLVTIKSPQFTTIPPQIHHQITTRKHPFFAKPPPKTPKTLTQKNRQTLLRKTGARAPRAILESLHKVHTCLWFTKSASLPL
jgi:hypothetical protein